MNQLTSTPPVQIPIYSFEEMARDVMVDLQASLSDLILGLPETIRRAVDLERALKLERKLAWQAFRLSRSSGFAEMANVPSLASAARLMDAAKSRGVPPPVIDRVNAAFERFETLVTEQCGDRSCLLSMVSGLTHEKQEGVEMRVRKAHFRSSAHLWGVQAQMQARTLIYVPKGPHGETLEAILVAGNIRLQGMSRGEPVTISSWLTPQPIEAPPGQLAEAPRVTPGFELLTGFCSHPLPEMVHAPGRGGVTETEMMIPPAGRAGAVTIYLTQRSPTEGDARVHGAGGGMFVSVPVVEIVSELLVPAGMTDPASARVAVFGRRHHPERVFEERRIDLLAQRESVSYFGPLDQAPAMDGAPRHQDAVRHVLASNGLAGMKFDVYRCRVQYPVLHSLVVMRVDPVRR